LPKAALELGSMLLQKPLLMLSPHILEQANLDVRGPHFIPWPARPRLLMFGQ
jgi:hypothetical protein